MKTITLQRIIESNNASIRCIFGVLINNETSTPFAVTLEQPWKDNTQYISCIPSGTYDCVKYSTAKFKDVYEIEGVMGRSDILLHKGNYLKDTSGCILVAEKFEMFGDQSVIADSRGGFADLTELIGEVKRWRLVIKSPLINCMP